MRKLHKIHNSLKDIEQCFRKRSYFIAPIVTVLFYLILKKFVKLEIDEEFNSNIINVSAVLSGFLLTSLGIITALPDNKFIQRLKRVGYMDIIHTSMFIGIILLTITLVLGLFNISHKIKIILFIAGLSETLLSSYYLYKITKLSSKSI